MSKNNTKIKEDRFLANDNEPKGHFHTDWEDKELLFLHILLCYQATLELSQI